MRKNFGAKPWLYPQPVLIIATYGEEGTPDAMNAAWGGIADMNRIAMYLSGSHKTVKNILSRKAFTVSMADAAHVDACDYVGIVSGNTTPDKMARAGFHVTKSEVVDAPVIDELPMTLECKLISFGTDRRAGKVQDHVARQPLSPLTRQLSFHGKDRPAETAPDHLRPCAQRLPRPWRESWQRLRGRQKTEISVKHGAERLRALLHHKSCLRGKVCNDCTLFCLYGMQSALHVLTDSHCRQYNRKKVLKAFCVINSVLQ